MPLVKRQELEELLSAGQQAEQHHIVLFFGERYLCREAADTFQQFLLANGAGAVNAIDGDQEDMARTLSRLLSFSLLPGKQIFRVTDSRLFHTRNTAPTIWQKAVEQHLAGKEAVAMRHVVAMARIAGFGRELQAPFSELAEGEWQTLFGFARPREDLGWADTLFVKAVGTGRVPTGEGTSPAERYISAFSTSIPSDNYLLLTTETVDKRQKLFTFIKKHGLIVDCSVATGSGAQAVKEQKEVLQEMMAKTLQDFQKTIEPRALELFFDRVGFHPVAVVTEMEKLALYAGERQRITCEDLEAMVRRSREDALFELTDAFGKRQQARTLTILNRLQESGTHGLAILATMRNYLRKLLIFRALQQSPETPWRQGMNASQFQQQYLPLLKESGAWQELLTGHPYALFMSFSKASEFSCDQLQKYLTLLLEAEYRLKGSPLPQQVVLEELFLSLLNQ